MIKMKLLKWLTCGHLPCHLVRAPLGCCDHQSRNRHGLSQRPQHLCMQAMMRRIDEGSARGVAQAILRGRLSMQRRPVTTARVNNQGYVKGGEGTNLGFSNSTKAKAGGLGGSFRSMFRMRPYCSTCPQYSVEVSLDRPAHTGALDRLLACAHNATPKREYVIEATRVSFMSILQQSPSG